jgi:hypothetical protein
MLGYFNEVLWDFKHFSTWQRPDKQMIDFCEILTQCDMHDLGFAGLWWTYDNMQECEGTTISGCSITGMVSTFPRC